MIEIECCKHFVAMVSDGNRRHQQDHLFAAHLTGGHWYGYLLDIRFCIARSTHTHFLVAHFVGCYLSCISLVLPPTHTHTHSRLTLILLHLCMNRQFIIGAGLINWNNPWRDMKRCVPYRHVRLRLYTNQPSIYIHLCSTRTHVYNMYINAHVWGGRPSGGVSHASLTRLQSGVGSATPATFMYL